METTLRNLRSTYMTQMRIIIQGLQSIRIQNKVFFGTKLADRQAEDIVRIRRTM